MKRVNVNTCYKTGHNISVTTVGEGEALEKLVTFMDLLSLHFSGTEFSGLARLFLFFGFVVSFVLT